MTEVWPCEYCSMEKQRDWARKWAEVWRRAAKQWRNDAQVAMQEERREAMRVGDLLAARHQYRHTKGNLAKERDEAREWARIMYARALNAEEECQEAYSLAYDHMQNRQLDWRTETDDLIDCLQELIDTNWPRRLGALFRLPPHLRDRIHVPGETC